MTTGSTFPIFYDGDVSILINPDVYSLHSSILDIKSGFLKRCNGAGPGAGRLFATGMLRLTFLPSAVHGRGVFEVQTFDAYNRQLEDAIAGIGIIWPDRLRTRWCSIFRILYNLDPMLESRDAESLFLETSEIIQIAEEELHANITFLQGIESALLHLDQITFHSIVLHPIPWSSIAKRLHSHILYQEAVIHLVGRWNVLCLTTPKNNAMNALDPYTRELCRRKSHDLTFKKKTIEHRLAAYYPTPMHRGLNGDLSCAAYAADIHIWMTIAFFRQWFSYMVIDRRNFVAADGGAALYRTIARGADASYLTGREQGFFHLSFPMSTRGCDALEYRLRELKWEVAGFVGELVVDLSQWRGCQVPYLTCCRVDREDLPWVESGVTGGTPVTGVGVGGGGVTGDGPVLKMESSDDVGCKMETTTMQMPHFQIPEINMERFYAAPVQNFQNPSGFAIGNGDGNGDCIAGQIDPSCLVKDASQHTSNRNP